MEWFVVLSLISVGLVLIVVEVIFVPGVTVVGLIGFGLLAVGVWLSFSYFDSSTGWGVTSGTAVASAVIFVWLFRSKPWKQFSLKTAINSKVNEGMLTGLKEGDEGIAISTLRPRGKAEIGNKTVEVATLGNYVDNGTRIKIIKITLNQILVEPLN